MNEQYVTEDQVEVAEGKYTVILRSDGTSTALRYHEPWPAYAGETQLDNLTVALARDLIDARRKLSSEPLLRYHSDPPRSGAIDLLMHHQRQLDADGIEVGVSRQALCEVLDAVNAAHNPQASSGGDEGKWLGPYKTAAEALDDCRKAVATEIGADPETWPDHGNAALAIAATVALARIRNRSGAAEGNEAEAGTPKQFTVRPSDPHAIIAGIRQFGLAGDGADLRDLEAAIAAPKPDPAIAELVEQLIKSKHDLQWKFGEPASTEQSMILSIVLGVMEEAIAALTASNDRVAELERSIDALEKLRPVWAQGWSKDSIAAQAASAALGEVWAILGASNQTEASSGLKALIQRVAAAEAEVSRLKAGAVTDEMVEAAARAIWLNLCGDIRQTPADVVAYSDAARAALEAALSDQAGASE